MPTYMQRMMFALSFGLLGVILIVSTAHANQTSCAKRSEVVAELSNKYGESLQNRGLIPNGHMLETYAHQQMGTWTILITTPEGTSCMIASGSAYESHKKPSGHGA